jgi:hypothetical protein
MGKGKRGNPATARKAARHRKKDNCFFQKIATHFKRNWLIYIMAMIINLPNMFPMYLVQGFDFNFHASRAQSIINSLRDGQIIPQVDPDTGINEGSGYGVNLYYPPLSGYAIVLLRSLSSFLSTDASWWAATSLFCLVTLIFIAFSMKKFLQELLPKRKRKLAVLGSITYMTSFNVLQTLYHSSDFAVLFAFAFIPILFLGLYRLVNSKQNPVAPIVIGAVGIALSHLLSVITVGLIAAIYLLLNFKKLLAKRTVKNLFLATSLAIMIAGFFIFPLMEIYLTGGYLLTDAHNYWGCWKGLCEESVVSGSVPLNELFFYSNSIRFIGIVSILSVLAFFIFRKKITPINRLTLNQMFVLSIICLAIATPLIELVIVIFPFMSILQFSTRFFVPLCFLLTTVLIISISNLSFFNKSKNIFLSVIIIFILNIFQYVPFAMQSLSSDIGLSKPFSKAGSIRPTGVIVEKDMYPITFMTDQQSLLDDYMSSPTTNDKNAVITNYKKTGSHINLSVTTQHSPILLSLPLVYYPGYTVGSNSQVKLNIGRTQNGLVQINIPENETLDLEIKYGLSLATILGLISTVVGTGLFVFIVAKHRPKDS